MNVTDWIRFVVIRTLIFMLFLLTSATVTAQNAISNPDFDDGLTGWSATRSGYSAVLNSLDGSPSSPSAEIDGVVFNEIPEPFLYSPCIAIKDDVTYVLSVNIKPLMLVEIATSADDDCSQEQYSTIRSNSTAIANGWFQLTSSEVGPFEGLRSMQLVIGGLSQPMLIDHASLRPAGATPVTLQSFTVD